MRDCIRIHTHLVDKNHAHTHTHIYIYIYLFIYLFIYTHMYNCTYCQTAARDMFMCVSRRVYTDIMCTLCPVSQPHSSCVCVCVCSSTQSESSPQCLSFIWESVIRERERVSLSSWLPHTADDSVKKSVTPWELQVWVNIFIKYLPRREGEGGVERNRREGKLIWVLPPSPCLLGVTARVCREIERGRI